MNAGASSENVIRTYLALLAEHAPTGPTSMIVAAEAAFVEVAADYARRHGIGVRAWREVGVPDEVLARAGLTA